MSRAQLQRSPWHGLHRRTRGACLRFDLRFARYFPRPKKFWRDLADVRLLMRNLCSLPAAVVQTIIAAKTGLIACGMERQAWR